MENNIKINNYIIDKDFITVDDMPNETFRDIVSICGMDTALKLLTKFSGNTILVPVKGFKNIEAKIILKEYVGHTPFQAIVGALVGAFVSLVSIYLFNIFNCPDLIASIG